MMLQIGLGYGPRALRPLQTQPAQGLFLVVASDNGAVAVKASALTIEVAPPSPHAGTYSLDLADLARGPVCLAPPTIRDAAGVLQGEPGLWAHDAARGAATITRQWLAGGTVVPDATGLSFAPVATDAAQDIVLAETVRQNGAETGSLSAPFTLPALPEPARLAVAPDARLALVVDPAGTAEVQIIEPATHAGSYTIPAAALKNGPLWLVPARVTGTAKVGSQLGVLYRGLPVSDAAAGPVSVQGQWQRDDLPIPGATKETYGVAATDAGCRIGFLETATDSHGTRRQLSNEIAIGGTS